MWASRQQSSPSYLNTFSCGLVGTLNSPRLIYGKFMTEFTDLFRRHKIMRLIMVRTKNDNYSYGGDWVRHTEQKTLPLCESINGKELLVRVAVQLRP